MMVKSFWDSAVAPREDQDMCTFNTFVGIDWSGSQGYDRGKDREFPIQVAVYTAIPELRLEHPLEWHNKRWKDNRWSRTTVANWLTSRINDAGRNDRLLIGFDFAFSFPYADLGRYFPNDSRPANDWTELLKKLAEIVGEDYGPSPFVGHDFYSQFFKIPGATGDKYEPRRRVTDRPEFLADQNPATVYKLIGGDQVGRGSIAGMALIHKLRATLSDKIHVWPFDGIQPREEAVAVLVEVWPRLLYEMVGVPSNAHAYPKVFKLALRECGMPSADTVRWEGENSGDALLTAAALYMSCGQENIWTAPDELAAADAPFEGWIWGAKRGDG